MDASHATSNKFLAHHFETMRQQREAVSLGMWLFLVTEVMFFGGIFLGYTIYRLAYPEMFHFMSHELDVVLGTVNTAVLLTSSLTMALAVNAAQNGKQGKLVAMLFSTFLLSLVFLVIKAFEYEHKFHIGAVPGSLFHFANPYGNNAQIFLSFYFGATGIHGLHVLIGTILIGWFTWRARRGHFPAENYQPVELLGLYWHFVDLAWIYVFPLFYLIGRS
jgi:cytochrome c oxidase subunit 3